MLQALLHPEQVRMRSGDDPDQFSPVSLTPTASMACTVRPASSIEGTNLTRQNDAAVPVQADERRDTDRQHHLMGSGPAHEGGDPLVEAREVRRVMLKRGACHARMVMSGRLSACRLASEVAVSLSCMVATTSIHRSSFDSRFAPCSAR